MALHLNAQFRVPGHFKSKISGEVIVGTWSRLDGTGALPFYLLEDGQVGGEGKERYSVAGVANKAAFEARLQKWRKAVLTGDRATVVAMINFPTSANVYGKPPELRARPNF